jgi:hypothetical protein
MLSLLRFLPLGLTALSSPRNINLASTVVKNVGSVQQKRRKTDQKLLQYQ